MKENITPSLSEVKEYFKDAEKIKSLFGTKFKNNNNFSLCRYDGDCIYAKGGKYTVWSPKQGYAKIISYKKPKDFTITKEQILDIAECSNPANKLKLLFPKAFEEEKKELIVIEKGKWYKSNNGNLVFLVEKNKHVNYGFGYHTKQWKDDLIVHDGWSYVEATNQEVEEALAREAVRRGFVENVWVDQVKYNGVVQLTDGDGSYTYFPREDYLTHFGWTIYSKGEWATLINILSIQQAEEKLKELGVNVKIV